MMNTHGLDRLFRRRNLVATSLLSFSLLVMAFGFAASNARSPQDEAEVNERRFESKIPENLPVKVKVKSEKSFKDLKNKGWLRELEVEVKNTGSKPIYYVHLTIHMPDVILDGHLFGTSVRYGRKELIYPETPVGPGDVPIMPGESATLKLHEQTVKSYEHHRDELGSYTDPKKVACWAQVIRFGDGTALWGPDGNLPPPEPKSKSSDDPKQKNGAEGCRSSPAVGTVNAPGGLFKVSDSWQPASLLRAYLLAPVDAPAPALAAAPDDCGCHSVSGCKWGNLGFANCPSCPGSELTVIFAGGVATAGDVCLT